MEVARAPPGRPSRTTSGTRTTGWEPLVYPIHTDQWSLNRGTSINVNGGASPCASYNMEGLINKFSNKYIFYSLFKVRGAWNKGQSFKRGVVEKRLRTTDINDEEEWWQHTPLLESRVNYLILKLAPRYGGTAHNIDDVCCSHNAASEKVEPTNLRTTAMEFPRSTRVTPLLVLRIQRCMWRNHHATRTAMIFYSCAFRKSVQQMQQTTTAHSYFSNSHQ